MPAFSRADGLLLALARIEIQEPRALPAHEVYRMSRGRRLAAWTLALVAVSVVGRAVPGTAAKPVRVHAITGVRVVASPGHVIENGTVVLRDGLIEAAGAGVAGAGDARVGDGKGLTVYAGLIDPYTVRPVPEPKDGEKTAEWANES